MKKIFVTIAAVVLAAGVAFAQDLSQVTELYNSAAEALNAGEKESALASFEQALTQAKALGEEGAGIVENCQGIIPTLYLSVAKDAVKAGDIDAAVEKLQKTAAVAEEFEAWEVASQAQDLIPQVLMQQAGKLLNAKDYDAAAAAYKKVLEFNPTNGMAALRLGVALNAAGDLEGALAAFDTASANGQEAAVQKQLSNIYLKQAAGALKEKKYAEAVEFAGKVNEIAENAQAYQIAAQASQLGGKNNDAIKYFEKYLEVSPDAKNAGQIAYTLGALYQQAGNKAKAKEFYQKASSDAKFGAEAKKMLDALK